MITFGPCADGVSQAALRVVEARAVAAVHRTTIAGLAVAVLPDEPGAVIVVAELSDSTARELIENYAPHGRRLVELHDAGALVIALSRADGLRLLDTPRHMKEASALTRIAAMVRRSPDAGFALTIACGGVWAQRITIQHDGFVRIAMKAGEGGPPS